MRLGTIMQPNELENFNHRYSATILHQDALKRWVFFHGYSGRDIFQISYPEGAPGKVRTDKIVPSSASREVLEYSTKIPRIGFYNDFSRGQSHFLSRSPLRQYKQTACPQNSRFHTSFLDLMPRGLYEELSGGDSSVLTQTWQGWLYLLNNNRYPEFEEAVKLVDSGDMLACAFHPMFMLSIAFDPPKDCPNALALWYYRVVIGHVDPATNRISLSKLLFKQEIQDILRDQNCKWQVHEQNAK